ncbi:MAG: SCP2 sterol-binding domain-containing protein [Streptosporangiaceae bacterium]
MATVEECRTAIDDIAARISAHDLATPGNSLLGHTIACHVTDLDVVFRGRLYSSGIDGITTEDLDTNEPARVHFTVGSDDLLALTQGELDLGRAWARGRVKVEASFRDLLRLRRLI